MPLLNFSYTATIVSTYKTVAKANTPAVLINFSLSQENFWCWAACAEMMCKKKYSQGEIVNHALARADCDLPRPLHSACITTINDSDIEDLAQIKLGYSHCRLIAKDITFSMLEAQINAYQMVEVGFTWKSSKQGHIVLVVATDNTGGQDTVTLHDPDQSRAIVNILYTDVQNAYGQGTWDATWLDMY